MSAGPAGHLMPTRAGKAKVDRLVTQGIQLFLGLLPCSSPPRLRRQLSHRLAERPRWSYGPSPPSQRLHPFQTMPYVPARERRILAVDPTPRGFGYAVLRLQLRLGQEGAVTG